MSKSIYKYKTIRIDERYNEVIKFLLKKSDYATEKEYVEAALTFFEKSELDPNYEPKSITKIFNDLQKEVINLKKELAKSRNTNVSFIREQEKKYLNPIVEELDAFKSAFLDFAKNRAVTKMDIQGLLQKPSSTPVQNPNNDIKRAKDLFQQLKNEFGSGMGGTMKIDKKTLLHYENQFNNL